MTVFNPFQILKILTPTIIWSGFRYLYRNAAQVVKHRKPDLRGPALWNAVLKELRREEQVRPVQISGLSEDIQVIDLQQDKQRLILFTSAGVITLTFFAPDLFRVRVQSELDTKEPFSYGVAKMLPEWEPVQLQVTELDAGWMIATDALRLKIEQAPFTLTALYPLTKQNILTNCGIHNNGGWWQTNLPADAACYGLGEKAFGLDLRGGRYDLWNSDPAGYGPGRDPIYLNVPMLSILAEGHGLGLFFDNSYRAWIDLDAERSGDLTYIVSGGELCVYVITGTLDRIISRFTDLTGRHRLLPLWAFGFHQSRWSYFPDRRVMEIARTFREKNLPADVIHLDIHYMDNYRCFTWDRRRFSDPAGMLNELHTLGFKAISIIDPGIKVDKGYSVYDEGVNKGYFISYPDGTPFIGPVWPGDSQFPDFTNPLARDWWGKQYQPLLDDGLDAFWNDMNEIALITPRTDHTSYVPAIVVHNKEGQSATHAEIHSVYGMLMARASQEGLQKLRPESRPLILTRSGWAGIQRYAMHWTGDNQSTWEHLRLTIPMVLNLGMSGISYTGPDTGGFTGSPSPELFTRWMQLSAFLPFFRTHSMLGSPDQEPWAFGDQTEQICRTVLEWRYRLLPYLYTAAWQSSSSGTPMIRSMAFMFPELNSFYRIDDQFFCGDHLLVAPILREGATERTVTLPEGIWYDYWTGEAHEGGKVIQVSASLDQIPVFARAGAAIPLWPVQQHVGEDPIDELTLRCFAGSTGSVLFEDDGMTPTTSGRYSHRLSHIALDLSTQKGIFRLNRVLNEGIYVPSYSSTNLEIFGLKAEPASVQEDSLEVKRADSTDGSVRLSLDSNGPFEVTIRF